MDAAHGATAPALNRLSRGIREYSLFQGVQLVLERLQAAHPELDEEALYQRLELQANPSMGFPGSDIDRVQFFEEHGELRARLRINLVSLFGPAHRSLRSTASRHWAIAKMATRPATSSTCSITACNAYCCPPGRNTATTRAFRAARPTRSQRTCLR